jgi:aspartate/methionine/tyrosine aminotransferase
MPSMQAPTFEYLNWIKARCHVARINLSSSGMPPPSEALVPLSRASRALDIVDVKGYEPLFDRVAAHVGLPRSRVLVVPGCTYAMHLAIRSAVGPGQEAVVETPTYELLPRVLEAHGALMTPVARRAQDGFSLRVEDVARAVTKKTRAVVVTSPHNPSGRLLPERTLAGLDDLARERGLYVIVDEVYLDFHPRDRRGYPSAARLSDRFIAASSLTKAHGLSSLRLGWIAGPPEIIEEAWRWQEILADRVPALEAQAGCVAFDHMAAMEARAWDAYGQGFPVLRAFAQSVGLELLDPSAGVTALLRLPEGQDSLALATRLFEKDGVLVPPGEMFGIPGWLRISFAVPEATLRAGLERIAAAIAAAR